MRKLCVFASLFVALCAAGCGSSQPAVKGKGPTNVSVAPHVSFWQQYLQVMTERERVAFLEILDDKQRMTWLRTNGIDVRAELATKLARGMTVETAKSRLNDPLDHQDKRGDAQMLYYSRFNGDTYTNYYLKFESNQLVNWNAYTLAQQDRTLDLVTFEAEISRRLDTVLRPGIGPRTIQQIAAIARKRLDETLGAHRERLTNTNKEQRTDYKRRIKIEYDPVTKQYKATDADEGGREVVVHRPSEYNYIVNEQVILSTSQADMLGWFAIEPSRKIVHRPFETHLFYIPYRSKRGDVETVIVEFSFKDGLLEQWFVYHDE